MSKAVLNIITNLGKLGLVAVGAAVTQSLSKGITHSTMNRMAFDIQSIKNRFSGA